jgi:predicted MFS family arabinose efflux permease
MQASVVFFIVGSAISTGANNMTTLLVGRGIAGIGAAGLLTVGSHHAHLQRILIGHK